MNDGRTPAHWAVANLAAKEAMTEIIDMARAAIERMNRRIGQHMRYHMARIELVRREARK